MVVSAVASVVVASMVVAAVRSAVSVKSKCVKIRQRATVLELRIRCAYALQI
jgi:hypothetical protein